MRALVRTLFVPVNTGCQSKNRSGEGPVEIISLGLLFYPPPLNPPQPALFLFLLLGPYYKEPFIVDY